MELEETNMVRKAMMPKLAKVLEIADTVLDGLENVEDYLLGYTEEYEIDETATPMKRLEACVKVLRSNFPKIGNSSTTVQQESNWYNIYYHLEEVFADESVGLRKTCCKEAIFKLILQCLELELAMLYKFLDPEENCTRVENMQESEKLNLKKQRLLSQIKVQTLVSTIQRLLTCNEWNPAGEVMCDICLMIISEMNIEELESSEFDCFDKFNCSGKQLIGTLTEAKRLKMLHISGKMVRIKEVIKAVPKAESKVVEYDENGFRIMNTAEMAEAKSKPPTEQVIEVKDAVSDARTQEKYRKLLRGLVFQYADFEYDTKKFGVQNSVQSLDNARISRINKEIAELRENLPSEASHSIYLVAHSKRIDLYKFMIFGTEGTPYAHGAFEFIMHLNSNYPQKPPTVEHLTNGYGSVMFHPVLKPSGMICLSLLGTWPGGDESQLWNPARSNLTQIILSIQTLILGDHTIFMHHPVMEQFKGTDHGEATDVAFSNVIRVASINYAMLNQLSSPPQGFEEVVRLHFSLKKDVILQTIMDWENNAKLNKPANYRTVKMYNPWCTVLEQPDGYLRQLTELRKAFKSELAHIKVPELPDDPPKEEMIAEKTT